jgi:uncharacterized protein DUF6328
MNADRREQLPLAEAVTHLLEECRMVLPGLQALFGFQLVAVFNTRFDNALTATEQQIHLLALGLVALAGALVMAPAAFHRQTGPFEVSENFVALASRLLLSSMIPLMLAISLDFYLIARVILANRVISLFLAIALLCLFSCLWFLLPRLAGLQRLAHGERRASP